MNPRRTMAIGAIAATAVLFACAGSNPAGPEENAFGEEFSAAKVEVAGTIEAIDVSSGSFTLSGGTDVQVSSRTTFDASGDFHSLAQAAAAIESGTRVRGRAEGSFQGSTLAATSVTLQSETSAEAEIEADEVEGVVATVDTGGGSFTLEGGVTVELAAGATIDAEGDLHALGQVEAALAGGATVRAEADGSFDGEVFVATTVKFQVDGEVDGGIDGEIDGDASVELDGTVTGVDVGARTFVVAGATVLLETDALIDASGDLHALAEVAAALTAGQTVRAEVDGTLDGGIVVATDVSFEIDAAVDGDDGADDDGDGGDGDASIEIDGIVTSVDLGARTFVVGDATVFLEADGLIDGGGDLTTLAAVAAALAASQTVEAEVDGFLDGGIVVATEVRFEIDSSIDIGLGDDDD